VGAALSHSGFSPCISQKEFGPAVVGGLAGGFAVQNEEALILISSNIRRGGIIFPANPVTPVTSAHLAAVTSALWGTPGDKYAIFQIEI
jgi:hypothetical protein